MLNWPIFGSICDMFIYYINSRSYCFLRLNFILFISFLIKKFKHAVFNKLSIRESFVTCSSIVCYNITCMSCCLLRTISFLNNLCRSFFFFPPMFVALIWHHCAQSWSVMKYYILCRLLQFIPKDIWKSASKYIYIWKHGTQSVLHFFTNTFHDMQSKTSKPTMLR